MTIICPETPVRDRVSRDGVNTGQRVDSESEDRASSERNHIPQTAYRIVPNCGPRGPRLIFEEEP